MPLTKTQIRRLGERLASTEFPSDADLDLLAEYETSFQPALDSVVSEIAKRFGLHATPRRKSVSSIVGKIRRERTRLSSMQDIAGCRAVVPTIADQEELVERLTLRRKWKVKLDDRRQHPSHGYRAVHLIVAVGDRWVEVQVRTRLQDQWAQISEKLADAFGIEVKYGGGDELVRAALDGLSEEVARVERLELDFVEAMDAGPPSAEEALHLAALEADLERERERLQALLDRLLKLF